MTARLVGYMISTALHSSRNLKTEEKPQEAVLGCAGGGNACSAVLHFGTAPEALGLSAFVPVIANHHLLVPLLFPFPTFPVQSAF